MVKNPEVVQNEVETGVIKEQFKHFEELLEDSGSPHFESLKYVDRGLRFYIDYSMEEASLMTSENVEVYSFSANETLGEYNQAFRAAGIISRSGERWIMIHLGVKNPYSPTIALWQYKPYKQRSYYIDSQEIFLSNEGRAFEMPSWSFTGVKTDEITEPIPLLKNEPTDDQIGVKFRLDFEAKYGGKPQPLSGQTLERLRFISDKHSAGQVING
ncbi:MAG: hypothetical protein NUV69_00250 [Candidatus Curtissbacteria bacterium]|nr:hypothetical protein [Candidatus Curtissbacteria bacterium]